MAQALTIALAGVLALGFSLGACRRDPDAQAALRPTPLPFAPAHPELPDDATILQEMQVAIERSQRAHYEQIFDAIDPGEGIEEATFTQLAIDAQSPGIDLLFAVGDELFDYEFRVENGLGNGLAGRPGVRAGPNKAPNMRRVHKSEFGGPDSYSCATCHSKGGPDGAGTNTQNAYLRGNGKNALSADERNAPHLLGLGPIAALAAEMTSILHEQRDTAIAEALASKTATEVSLEAKGVDFGRLRVSEAGVPDTSGVRGVDEDLIVKPFGWKGHQATLRGMIEESFRIHMGIVSMREQAAFRDGLIDKLDIGDGTWFDVDRDGVATEVEAGMLSTLEAYLAQLQIPVVRPPRDERLLAMFSRGEAIFDEIGCGHCHRPALELHKPELAILPGEARYADRRAIIVNVATDGEHPKIDPLYAEGSAYRVRLFSDLRRHDMGPELNSGYQQGHLGKSIFLTRPLWGLADTAPYLHDGRAPTVHDAIVWHGGEAQPVRDIYLGLDKDERDALLIFLLSLDREPQLASP